MPCLISHQGLRQVIDLGRSDEEMAMFRTLVDSVRTAIACLNPAGTGDLHQ